MDIQVGDKITWTDGDVELIDTKDRIEDIKNFLSDEHDTEISKIERPQYTTEYKKGFTTHHLKIKTEDLKDLIRSNHKWNDYNLKGKIEIAKRYAEFDNDTDLLEFLEYMEEK